MYQKIVISCAAAIFFVACTNNSNNKNNTNATIPARPQHQESMPVKTNDSLKSIVLASNKDFVCGMPVKAGIADTCLYKGKVYGFCSEECKAEFKKTPRLYLAAK